MKSKRGRRQTGRNNSLRPFQPAGFGASHREKCTLTTVLVPVLATRSNRGGQAGGCPHKLCRSTSETYIDLSTDQHRKMAMGQDCSCFATDEHGFQPLSAIPVRNCWINWVSGHEFVGKPQGQGRLFTESLRKYELHPVLDASGELSPTPFRSFPG